MPLPVAGRTHTCIVRAHSPTNSSLCSFPQVVNKIIQSDGPLSAATKTQYSRFHDDKSTYTGVHKRGGPSTYDGNKDICALLDRSPADIRGRGGQFMQPVQNHKPAASFDAIHGGKIVGESPGWKKLRNVTKASGMLSLVGKEGSEALELDLPKPKVTSANWLLDAPSTPPLALLHAALPGCAAMACLWDRVT